MIRALTAVASLCLALPAIAQQTSIAPSPTPAAQQTAPATPRRGRSTPLRPATQPSGQGSSQTPAQRSAQVPGQAASTAPLGDSKIEIIGDPQHAGQPSDDKPMLPIVSVPNSLGLRSGTPIRVRLVTTADSGHLVNGNTVPGTLAEPLAGLPTGTPVTLTVIMASRAGAMVSYGELSLQVTDVASRPILSDIVTAIGKEGKKEIADAAPATGTEAEFPAGQDFTFPAA